MMAGLSRFAALAAANLFLVFGSLNCRFGTAT
jgi:hypothetical protein